MGKEVSLDPEKKELKRPNKEKKCPEAGWQVVPKRGQKTATNGRGEGRAGGKRRQRTRKNK